MPLARRLLFRLAQLDESIHQEFDMRFAVATLVVSLLLPIGAAWPCGGPFPADDGRGGTALFEGPDQVSAFSVAGDGNGLSWDRLHAPTWSATHVANIPGGLDGNIETSALVDTAISSQDGGLVEVSASGVVRISSASGAATSVFGAAVDADQHWQVLAFAKGSNELTLFAESAPGQFAAVASTSANCGNAAMLDLVIEPDGTRVGICGGSAVVVYGGALELITLPVAAIALGHASTGLALFYGLTANNSAIVQMSHAQGSLTFTTTATITPNTPPAWFIATSETSVVAADDSAGTSATEYTFANGSWSASPVVFFDESLISAVGSPARLLVGQYKLRVYSPESTDAGVTNGWSSASIATLGVPPVGAGFFCAAGGLPTYFPMATLVLLMLLARAQRRSRVARAASARADRR
jgi:hypothetical protein